MKRYEGLFILDTSGREDSAKDIIDRVSKEMTDVGCTIETVQKMDKRSFARTANKKHSSGFYANVVFSAEPTAVTRLHTHFKMDTEVLRVLFTLASGKPSEEGATAAATATATA